MTLSAGWLWLLGGVLGAIKGVITKKYYLSKANDEFLATEDEPKVEVIVTPLRRWTGVALCCLIAFIGVWLIQRDGNWNPFSSAGTVPLTQGR
jgi:hypothetical protein